MDIAGCTCLPCILVGVSITLKNVHLIDMVCTDQIHLKPTWIDLTDHTHIGGRGLGPHVICVCACVWTECCVHV